MAIPGFYVWEVPGKWISIELSLDVVDRLQQDVIRGFGAVPRRGAEVGGILLGSVSGGGRVVRVEDYQQIPIEYKRGPSFLLSEPDRLTFDTALVRLRDGASLSNRPIGYFRSHTRDGAGLGEEDLELVAQNFPDAETIVLLIRPFGTKPSMAGFYFKEDGKFQSGPPLLEFPFRRKDLAPNDVTPAPERSRVMVELAETPALRAQEVVPPAPVRQVPIAPEPTPVPELVAEAPPKPRSRFWNSAIWLPLSVVFLLLGLLLGFQAALTIGPHPLSTSDPYKIALTASQSGNNVEVKWDRLSPVIQKAQKGVLTIEEGAYRKPIQLDAERLRNGMTVIYRHYSNQVRFRLEVFLKDTSSLTETVEWKQ